MTLTDHVAEYGHSKYDWYFPFFDECLLWVDVDRLLEIGCSSRSLRTWAMAFPMAEIVGLDLSPRGPTNTDDLTTAGVNFILGDQTDMALLESLGAFDVVVDDGSHVPADQMLSFLTLFPRMNSGGWYFIEDLHTSYAVEYEGTIFPFLQGLLDDLHARYRGVDRRWPVAEIRFVDSLVAIRRT